MLKEAYAVIWLIFGALFLFFSCWKKAMDVLAAYVGIYYPPALLFLLLILTLVLVLIQFSIVISKQSEQITKLAQEIALLKYKKRRKRKNKKTIEPIPNTSGEPPCNEDLT